MLISNYALGLNSRGELALRCVGKKNASSAFRLG